MSTAYTLARKRDPLHEPIADDAQWWRLRLNGRNFADKEYAVMTQIDNVDKPQVATIIFNDGLDEQITAEAVRTGLQETRYQELGCNALTSLIPGNPYFDLLTIGRPTSSPLWRPLTERGNFHHPDGDQTSHNG